MNIRHCLASAAACAILLSLPAAASAQTVFDWNGSSGESYGNVFNWTPLGVPDNTSESARFQAAGTFDVTLSSGTTTTVSDLLVNDGVITFAANGAIFATYATDDDALIEGGDFTLSRTGGSGDVVFNVGDDMFVNSDSHAQVLAGSDMNVSGRLEVGTTSNSDALITISDSGSTLDVRGNVSLGLAGSTGRLVIEDEATGVLAAAIDVGVSGNDNTAGELSVLTGADLTTGSIQIGSGTNPFVTGQQARLFVNGLGSTLTVAGASTLEVGSAVNSDVTAELFVQNFGQFTTGTGAIDIVNSGRLVIAGSSQFINNGPLTVDGGTIDQIQNGAFTNGVGSSLTATNNAQLNFTSDQRINNGVTWTLQDGAVYTTDTTFDDLAVGQSTGGTLVVEGSGTSVDLSAGGSGIVGSLGGTGTMTVRDSATATFGRLLIGNTATAGTTGVLNVEDGAVVDTDELEVAELAGPTTSGTVNIGDAGSTSQLVVGGTGTITVGNPTAGNGTGAIHIREFGELVTGAGQTTIRRTGVIDINAGTLQLNGDLTIDAGELRRDNGGTLSLAANSNITLQSGGQLNLNDSFLILGNGETLTIDSGSSLSATGPVSFGAGGDTTVVVEGGSSVAIGGFPSWGSQGGNAQITFREDSQLDVSSLAIGGIGDFTVSVDVESGADFRVANSLSIASSTGSGDATLTVSEAGSTVTSTSAAPTRVGQASGGTGTLNILPGGSFTKTAGSIIINATGVVYLDGGALLVETIDNSSGGSLNFISGALTINSGIEVGSGAPFPRSYSLKADQQLITPATTTVDTGRTLSLNGGSLKTDSLIVNGAFHFNSGTLELTGGGVTGLSTLIIPTNGALRATGTYTVPFAALGGSTVTSTGNLTLGDASSVAGFYANGAVSIVSGTTTLLDANDAVFDSGADVTLGDGAGGSANLIADNGLTLDFGGNLSGFGTVGSPNNSATPVTNNGHIAGNSLAEPITLTGYVKGVGTCDNCNITGTDSPGFSPATVNRGSVSYNGTLQIEIGGTSPGSFDQLNHILGAGIADLGGTLDVDLINGFSPAAGDTFEIITAASMMDTFDSEDVPALGGGLSLDVVYSATSVELVVVGVPGDYNFDGQVDAADYPVWRDTLGSTGSALAADGNGDGLVDNLDYGVWKTNFGISAATLRGNASVPEPSGLALLGLSSLLALAGLPRKVIRNP